jgi:DNA-binding winged helix-turn-helix (wHTH) protein/predicted ATPase
MDPIKHVTFGDFRLDPTNECLWQGLRPITLRPKAYAVLRHLVDRPGQLVTKRQLLEAVWPGTFVGDAVLKVTIRQLRESLNDDADSPRYIETSHRRGYRFIGPISEEVVQTSPARVDLAALTPPEYSSPGDLPPISLPAVGVLGREAEFARMRGWLERALRGERQVVFVTGEAGIGKTTLVNALLDWAAAVPGILMARGQCLEHYGAAEAYLPVLDGFSRLGRTPAGEWITALLRQCAPAWLLELPSLMPAGERETLQKQVVGATRERMLREMAEAIEAMSALTAAPLILVLEDLHWSDYSTLDLIAYLARRRDPARLMVIGTYRPVDVILSEHPLKGVKRELQAHGLCQELPLEYLTEEDIEQYLANRLPRHELPRRLARLLHHRTEGNPLFMVNVVQYLIDERVIVESGGSWKLGESVVEIESGVPENVKQLIEKQIERLSADERRVLEGASVVGMECSCTAIAAGLDEPADWVEERCEALVRRHQFLAPARIVELPDGTLTPRYKFSHVLYLEVPYRLLPTIRRAQIHGRIGRSGEAIYGDRVGEIAAELAMHFEQARDKSRAVKYLLQAAETAIHRSAQHEAAALARRGLLALESLPESSERSQQELSLRMILGVALMATKGFAAAEVEQVYRRALELCELQGAATQAFMVQWLLGLFHYFRAELQPAHQIAGHLLELAADLPDDAIVMEAHRAVGVTLVDLGRFGEALEHLEKTSALYTTRSHVHVSFAGQDAKVVSECFAGRALWALGYPDRAVERVHRGLALAKDISHAESLVIANHFAAHVYQLRGETSLALERAETVIALSDEYGLELWSAFGRMNRGWARVEHGQVDDGIHELQRGLAAYEATGAKLFRTHFLGLLAQALGGAGRVEEGLTAVREALALAQRTSDNSSAAELHRIHGELLIQSSTDAPDRGARGSSSVKTPPPVMSQADACFKQGLSIARQQDARSWELRIVTSLGRLYQRQAKRAAARQVVRETYNWFTEGHETADLKSAQALVDL